MDPEEPIPEGLALTEEQFESFKSVFGLFAVDGLCSWEEVRGLFM